jgi:hypothetical protein
MGPRPEGKIRQNSQRNAFPSPFRYVTVARASPSPMALGSAGGFIAAAHGEYPRGAPDTVWHSDMLTIATAMGGMPPASSAGNASMAVSASVQSCGVNEQVTDVFDPACPGEAGAGLNGNSLRYSINTGWLTPNLNPGECNADNYPAVYTCTVVDDQHIYVDTSSR